MTYLRLAPLAPLVFAALSFLTPAWAQCPTWTPEFPSSATLGGVGVVHLDESGAAPRLIVAGSLTSVAGVPVNGAAEYDGQGWSPIAPGAPFIPTAITTRQVGGTREIVIAGSDAVARWDGSAWSDLGLTAGVVQGLEYYDDGNGPALFVGGSDLRAGAIGPSLLLRYDGVWTSVAPEFTASPSPFISDLLVHNDGSGEKLYIGGRFPSLGGVTGLNLLRYDATGLQPAGPPGGLPPVVSGFRQVTALASSERAGRQVLHVGLGGPAQTAQGLTSWLIEGPGAWIGLGAIDRIVNFTVERRASVPDAVWGLTPDGLIALDGTLRPLQPLPPFGFTNQVAWFPGTGGPEIWIGGFTDFFLSSPLAFWDGTNLNLPGPAGSGPPFAVQTLIEHDFGAGNEFVAVTANFGDRPIYRNGGAGWTEIPRGGFFSGESIVSHEGSLYVVSRGSPVRRLDGTQWTPIDTGSDSFQQALEVASVDLGSGPELYVGGTFTGLSQPNTGGIARLEGQQFVSVGGGINPVLGFDTVCAIVGWDDGRGSDLYIGGGFRSVGGVAAENVARWTGTAWEALPGGPVRTGIGFSDEAVLELVAGEIGGRRLLFAAGIFDQLGSAPSTGLAAWDGAQWFSIDGDVNDPVRLDNFGRGLAVHDPDGAGDRLYVAGRFMTPSGIVTHVGSWDGTSWQLVPGTTAVGARDLHSTDRGDGRALYVGGSFASFAGVSADNVARLDDPCGRIVGTPYCTALTNFSGGIATCRASGSSSVAANNLVLHLEDAPAGSFALFALGSDTAAPAALGSGRLCLGGVLERILPPGLTSGAGSLTVPLDLTAPYASMATPGATLHAQAFFRDTAPTGATLGTSDGLTLRFVP